MVDGASKAGDKASLLTSRRSFLRGSKLVAGAGLAAGLALIFRGSPVKAMGQLPPMPGTAKCFLPQTRIATPGGEVKIEELRVGDSVLTCSGEVRTIKWVGRQQFERASHPDKTPVKISCFAIDGKTPHADLYVSPEHAIYIDGILIPARNLVNGITIQANAKPEMPTITYYNIELDTHEVVLAEGLSVETFNGVGRGFFDNADEFVQLYGSVGKPLTPFAPVASYSRRRHELASHVRSTLAPVYDFRKPIDKVRDRIADSAELAHAA